MTTNARVKAVIEGKRRMLGLSQDQLGLSNASLDDVHTLQRLATQLHLDCDYLISLDNADDPDIRIINSKRASMTPEFKAMLLTAFDVAFASTDYDDIENADIF